MTGIMLGGSAIIEAVAAQNFMNPRREMRWLARTSPSVLSLLINQSPLDP
jgi:hypothetical protein